ncbi:CD276 antigen isoform X2 [Centroberyx affinis]|uniref:CD276 antigen isoform X2 n=1 Tax=Centroberyx affinis TaxID=166261 RepID=UPI003A5C1EFF
MMVSRSKLLCFLCPSQVLAWLVLTLTLYLSLSIAGAAAQIQVTGEVGGNVTFLCPSDKQRTLAFLYFQKGSTFMNGYHAKGIREFSNRTLVNPGERSMALKQLKVSDNGAYTCHLKYDGSNDVSETVIHLSVKATYSTPALSVFCRDGSSCLATCASHGGYPSMNVTWNVNATSQWWGVVNSSKETDSDSQLFNSSSTAYFNCSHGPLQSLSCSVGGVTSEEHTVCELWFPPEPPVSYVTAICAGVVVSAILAILLLYWKYRKGKSRGAMGARKLEETIVLKGEKGEVEAP